MKRTLMPLRRMFLLTAFGVAVSASPVFACCPGSPPGDPSCYKCEGGVWVLKSWADCGNDDDCSGCKTCESCDCEDDDEACDSGEICENGDCCVDFGGDCDTDDECCTGKCNPYSHTCVECEYNSDCGECEWCEDYLFWGYCVSILPCPEYTHCDNHLCIADCEENGPACSYVNPPIQSNCNNSDPTDRTCSVWEAGRTCRWVVVETLHYWTANCVIPGCYIDEDEPCVKIKPATCSDHSPLHTTFCHCCEHPGFASYGTPGYAGEEDVCPSL